MKKLLIAAAIVCVAAISQASTFTWGTTDGSKAYVYDYNNDAAGVGYIEFFVNGTLVATSSAFDSGDGSATFSGITLNSARVVDEVPYPDDVLKAVAHLTNFADGEGYREWEFTFTDAWYTPQPGDTEAGIALMNQMNSYFDAGGNGIDFSLTAAENGYKAVPEPTSGLLLLLGIAGMALKRKRA